MGGKVATLESLYIVHFWLSVVQEVTNTKVLNFGKRLIPIQTHQSASYKILKYLGSAKKVNASMTSIDHYIDHKNELCKVILFYVEMQVRS